LLGYQPKAEPRNVALVGVRDLDSKERRLIKESGVHVFTMRDIDERGMRDVMSEALRFRDRRHRRHGRKAWTWISWTRPTLRELARRCEAA